MGKHDKWYSNLPYPSKDETPIYCAIYAEYVNQRIVSED